jgi:hypothetical protein
MSLDDLESKLLSEPAPKGRGSKPAPVKKEKPAKKEEAAPAPAPAPVAPAKKERASKVKYVDLPPAPTPAPAPKPTPVKVERKPREEKPKPVPAPRSAPTKTVVAASTEKDPNASTLGVALGAAPLIIAPFAALAGARGALSKTQARRAQIQKEIEEKEAARKKLERNAEVDGGGVASALVSFIVVEVVYLFVCGKEMVAR